MQTHLGLPIANWTREVRRQFENDDVTRVMSTSGAWDNARDPVVLHDGSQVALLSWYFAIADAFTPVQLQVIKRGPDPFYEVAQGERPALGEMILVDGTSFGGVIYVGRDVFNELWSASLQGSSLPDSLTITVANVEPLDPGPRQPTVHQY